MKFLKVLTTKNLDKHYSIREAVRIIAFDKNNKMPILHVSNRDYHKLPGGGIESGENHSMTLEREVLEEVGSKIEITGEVGKTIEIWEEEDQIQISYCYSGKILKKGEVNYTDEEIVNEFELKWVSIDEAIKLIYNDNPKDYEGRLICKRDLLFLKTYHEQN